MEDINTILWTQELVELQKFWMFSGTGDYERLTSKDTNIDNIMYGFRDKDYPLFKEYSDPYKY